MEIEYNIPLTAFHRCVNDTSEDDEKNNKLFMGATNEANYMEYMINYGKFVGEFLSSMGQKFKSIYESDLDIPNTDYLSDNLQKRFEKIFINTIRETNKKAGQQKSYKFIEKFLERGILRAIIDVSLILVKTYSTLVYCI
jgi:hypothetical protein